MKSVILLIVLVIVLDVNGDVSAETFDIKPDNEWDFIVVGAGASGCVVAARLANETNQEVLLLEGGRSGSGQRDIGGTDYVAASFKTNSITGKKTLDEPLTRYDVPFMWDSIRMRPDVLDNMWNINATGFFFAQARVIGGNMATNGMAWVVPTKSDFDDWGVPGYKSADMWSYMKRIENATGITGYGANPNRGYSGRTSLKFASFVQQEQYRFQNACNAFGLPTIPDMNTGTIVPGIALDQNNIKGGVRESTSITYLAPVLAKRRNLNFRTSAIVTRVLFNSANRAIGVEYSDAVTGGLKQVFARKEVIISAGDLQTAKILFNSGIGPRSILTAFKKPLRVVNDIIGQKIRNQQRAALTYADKTIVNANIYNYPAASMQYAEFGTGILEGRALMYTNYYSGVPGASYPDMSATPGLVAGSTPNNPYAQGFTVTVSLNRNIYANGTLNLTSSDPLAPTSFKTNLFVVQSDVERIANGMLKMRQIMKFWNGSAIETSPGPSYDTVAKLVPWIRQNGGSHCHYMGSVPMGTSPSAPADLNMRVRGVTSLRLVGPAVIPGPTYPGLQALAVALGEKGTDLIKAQYGL